MALVGGLLLRVEGSGVVLRFRSKTVDESGALSMCFIYSGSPRARIPSDTSSLGVEDGGPWRTPGTVNLYSGKEYLRLYWKGKSTTYIFPYTGDWCRSLYVFSEHWYFSEEVERLTSGTSRVHSISVTDSPCGTSFPLGDEPRRSTCPLGLSVLPPLVHRFSEKSLNLQKEVMVFF